MGYRFGSEEIMNRIRPGELYDRNAGQQMMQARQMQQQQESEANAGMQNYQRMAAEESKRTAEGAGRAAGALGESVVRGKEMGRMAEESAMRAQQTRALKQQADIGEKYGEREAQARVSGIESQAKLNALDALTKEADHQWANAQSNNPDSKPGETNMAFARRIAQEAEVYKNRGMAAEAGAKEKTLANMDNEIKLRNNLMAAQAQEAHLSVAEKQNAANAQSLLAEVASTPINTQEDMNIAITKLQQAAKTKGISGVSVAQAIAQMQATQQQKVMTASILQQNNPAWRFNMESSVSEASSFRDKVKALEYLRTNAEFFKKGNALKDDPVTSDVREKLAQSLETLGDVESANAIRSKFTAATSFETPTSILEKSLNKYTDDLYKQAVNLSSNPVSQSMAAQYMNTLFSTGSNALQPKQEFRAQPAVNMGQPQPSQTPVPGQAPQQQTQPQPVPALKSGRPKQKTANAPIQPIKQRG